MNIRFTEDGTIKIIDYVKWAFMAPKFEKDQTLGYMPPEFIRTGKLIDEDAWQIGIIILMMCHLSHPFEDDQGNIIEQKILKMNYPPITDSELLNQIVSNLICDGNNRPYITQLH